VHEKARKLACVYAECSGAVPSLIQEIVDYTGFILKYNPDQPRVPAGNPDGRQWTSGGNDGDDNGGSPFIDVTVNDPPIQPVYPIETALTFLLGGEAVTTAREALGLTEEIGAAEEGAPTAESNLTDHATLRMEQRGITDEEAQNAIQTAQQTGNTMTQTGK